MDKEQFLEYFYSEQGRKDFEEAARLMRAGDTVGLANLLSERRASTWMKACNYCKGYPQYKECYCEELDR